MEFYFKTRPKKSLIQSCKSHQSSKAPKDARGVRDVKVQLHCTVRILTPKTPMTLTTLMTLTTHHSNQSSEPAEFFFI